MNARRSCAALSVGVLVAASGAGIALANRTATMHTLKFTAHSLKLHNFTHSGVQSERDTRNGNTVGFDVVDCVFGSSAASCDAQYALQGGSLFIHFTITRQHTSSGKVTGGTRQFKGATGTMTASPGSTNDATNITINYQT